MTLINAEKFVERIQDCGTDETKQKVADALCFLVKTEAEFHPVEAIPIEWIRKYTEENRLYQSDDFDIYINDMIADWAERRTE